MTFHVNLLFFFGLFCEQVFLFVHLTCRKCFAPLLNLKKENDGYWQPIVENSTSKLFRLLAVMGPDAQRMAKVSNIP